MMEKQYFTKLREIKQQDVKVLLKKSYRGIWETAIKKYSDSAHFVYELLQNADDARATRVEFTLEEDGLWFKHNGTERFTISDPENEDEDSEKGKLGHINSITSIGNSSKSENVSIDIPRIGKFGIGFKAVFAYSSTPEIYDHTFNFKLENYIVPTEIDNKPFNYTKEETLFYFPFDHKEKTKEQAYKEIGEKLETLFQPLLFLTNLNSIKWVSNEKNGKYSKNIVYYRTFDNAKASFVETIKEMNGLPIKENIWLMTQSLLFTSVKIDHNVAVGFFLNDDNKLKTSTQYPAFCYFPTKEETKLGFLIHGPFILTDNREGINASDSKNIKIIEAIANLAAQSLSFLKNTGLRENTYLVDDNILDLIPYNPSVFTEVNNKNKISFRPFYDTIFQKFSTDYILPGRDGNYYHKWSAYWATDSELAELFTDKQISVLMDNSNSGFVFVTKGQKQLNQANKALENYINSLVIETIDPKKLLRKITANFIESQTDEWLLNFYSYLGGRKHLWSDSEKLALKRPILLNQNRKAVVPFDDELTTPNIFLPTDRATSHDTIYHVFVNNEEAMDFFKSLGIGNPDLKAEIFKTIIPQYKSSFDYNNTKLSLLFFEAFLLYFESCPLSEQNYFTSKLKEINFIAGRNAKVPTTRWFCKPSLLYFNDEKLRVYFATKDDTYFLDEDYYKDYIKGDKKIVFESFLKSLGVSSIPRINNITRKVSAESKEMFGIDHYHISPTYHNRQVITDKIMDGLEEALKVITPELSVYIWDCLLHYIENKTIITAKSFFSGSFNFVPKSCSYMREVEFDSSLIAMLQNDNWLFDQKGNCTSSKKLKKETLSQIYDTQNAYANVLLELLGIENPDADLKLTDEQKQALIFGRRLLEEGVTQEELSEFLKAIAARKKSAKILQERDNFDETTVEDEEIEATLNKLRKGIKKRQIEIIERKDQIELPFEVTEEVPIDQDEYTKPSVDLQKKIDKLKLEAEGQIEELTRIEKLNEIVNDSEQYSYAWFKALLELEYLSSSESNSQGKQISIQFTHVEKEPSTERTLILKHPNRYIPQSIEDIGDIQIRLYHGDESTSVTVEVVSVKEYTLRAKLKKSVDIADIDLAKVSLVVLDVKNPVFILEELRKAFYQLDYEDEYNLQENLTENIRFIFGPPGTGKTTYLATDEIIPLMQQEEELKILVLAPTNKSADVLTKRIMEKMGTDETYYEWLLRFGTAADPELEGNPILVDKNFNIGTKPRNTTITTIARFAYDYFQPSVDIGRLHLKFLQWDYVIIDEASMVTIASIAYVLHQLKESKFIIAGDPFQIQPITQIEQWKDMNIYEMVHLDTFVNPVTVPHAYEIVNLGTQYRSIPTIGDVFSHFTYKGILKHHRTAADQKPLNINQLDFKDINIIKFPVSNYESIYKPNYLNKSNYQIYSALFTVEFVKHLVSQIESSHKDNFKIGIICPYKAHATLIEKILSQHNFEGKKTEVQVGTIHGFQGDECDIIIAIFNPPFSISKSPNMFLNKQNILNVSISRARDYLIVIMPDDKTQNVDNLYKIKKIENLIYKHAKGRFSVYDSEKIEEIMFGSETYIFDNSFATSHQSVNVYSKAEKRYEIRVDEFAVDIQMMPIEE